MAAPEWRRDDLRSGCASSEYSEGTSPSSWSRQQLAQARASALPKACYRILENEVQQQRWTKRGPDFVESGEKAMQALQKDQENFEQAQQEVIQETDLEMLMLEMLMQEAPLPVMPVAQVNVSLVKTLEALTGIIEPDTRNPGVEGNPPELCGYHVSGGWRSFGRRVRRSTGSRAVGSGRRRGRGARSGRAASGGDKGTQSRSGAHTDDAAAEDNAHRGARGCGAGWCPAIAGPTVVSASEAVSQRHGTVWRFRNVHVRSSQPWQVPEILKSRGQFFRLHQLSCPSQESAAVETDADVEQDPELWDQDEDERSRGDGGLR